MSYAAWEINAGDALNQVAVFCRHLLKNGTTFTEETQPSYEEVEYFLTNNYSKMVGTLARYGIGSAQTDVNVIRILQSYLVACTVVDVERTQPNAGMNKSPNLRFTSFMDQCMGFEKSLYDSDIQSILGIVFDLSSTQGPEWTGTSKARKRILRQDTDAVQPDITRDMMKNPHLNPGYDDYI